MSDRPQLKAATRTIIGKKAKHLRTTGYIPANLYGKGIESVPLTVSDRAFGAIYAQVGETGIVDLLTDDGDAHPVLIHETQRHPVSRGLLHIDFYQVNLLETVTVQVPTYLVGQAPAVREGRGLVMHLLQEIEVAALPDDLPDRIEVDVSSLNDVDDVIRVESLSVPPDVTLRAEPDEPVARIGALRVEEEEPAAAEVAELPEGEEPAADEEEQPTTDE